MFLWLSQETKSLILKTGQDNTTIMTVDIIKNAYDMIKYQSAVTVP